MDGQTRAKIGRDRCLAAIVTNEDEMTRQSLWRAAMRFHWLMKAYMLAATVEDVPLCL